MKMDEATYFKELLEKQQKWYSQKGQYCKKWFRRLSVFKIIAASIIPFLAGLQDAYADLKWGVGGLGVLVAVVTAVVALFKFEENWITYRTTSEKLKHEKFLYLTGAAPYNFANKFDLLVKKVESLISSENMEWAAYIGNDQSTAPPANTGYSTVQTQPDTSTTTNVTESSQPEAVAEPTKDPVKTEI